jgi:hypothetical protein
MRCLRIYSTPDGESHFGEVDIAMTMKPAFPNEAPFELSAYYPASRIRFAHIPAGVREAGFHTPPDRLLAIGWMATWNLNERWRDETPSGGKSCSRRGYARERTHLAPPRGRTERYHSHTAERPWRTT